MTNDAASVEANYLTQQLSLITKAVMFFGAFIMMLFYSPLMAAIAAALTVLPFIASLLTGGRLEAAERNVAAAKVQEAEHVNICAGRGC